MLTVLIAFSTLKSTAQDQWVIKDSINGAPKSASSAFTIGGEAFLLAGLDADGFRRKFYSYKYSIDDWDDEGSIGGANGSALGRASATGFTVANKGYICLGQGDTNPFFKDLWEYNHDTDVWTQKADFIGSARRSAVGFTIDNEAFVGTGIDENGFKKDMYKYNPTTNSWTQVSDFAGSARKEAVGFSMGAQAYIGTGDDGVLKKDFWKYESSTDTWSQLPDFPGTARKGACGWGIFPQAFIATGEDINFEFKKDLWEFNYFSGTWTQRADFLGAGRSNAIAFVLEGVSFIGSGYNGDFLDDLYAYRRILKTEENELNLSLNTYPNPSTKFINITGEFNMDEFKLFSNNGQNVTEKISVQETSTGLRFYKNDLSSGTYFAKCSKDNKTYNSMIVFQ